MVDWHLYLSASREIKRIDSISKSPIYQHFGETLSGVSTIRAYGVGNRFISDSFSKVDNNNRPFFYLWVANRWLSFRIDLAGALVSFSSAAMIILNTKGLSAGLAGLSLSYALTFNDYVLWIVRLYAVLEMNMNSIERLQEYMDIEKRRQLLLRVPVLPLTGLAKVRLKSTICLYVTLRIFPWLSGMLHLTCQRLARLALLAGRVPASRPSSRRF